MRSFQSDSAADEMNDLEAIAIGKAGLRPLVAGDYFAVELNCDSVRLQTHLRDESSQSRWTIVDLRLAVDLQLHE